MEKKVLLDANVLIAALDDKGNVTPEKRQQAKKQLRDLLSDENVALAISPLIRYEVLRGVDWLDTQRHEKLRDRLNAFEEFEINREIAELATALYRIDLSQTKTQQNKNLDKRNFDVFHYATAKCLQFDIVSQDSDIAKLDKLMRVYQQQVGSKSSVI